MNMEFIGKWSLAAPDGKYLGIDPKTGILGFASDTMGAEQKFNAYGSLDKFILQATNGKYVTANDDGYKADTERDAKTLIYFSLEAVVSSTYRVFDLGPLGSGTQDYYWNENEGRLVRIEKIPSLPATAQFVQTIVTVGLAYFKERGFPTPNPDLSYVYLSGIDLTDVNFTQSDLSMANLSGANLTGGAFQKSTLDGADLSRAALSGMADFTGATLKNASLAGAKMTDVIMTNADLSNADLSGADMTGNSLTNTQCQGARFNKTILASGFVTGTNFTGATLADADFTSAVVRNINLIDANLSGAQIGNKDPEHPTIDLSDAKLSRKTNFTRATMQYVDLRHQNLEHIDMAHTDLTGSKLDNARLSHAELSYADLTNATLTGSIPMHAANLSNATLESADLTGAQMGSISLLLRVSQSDQSNAFKYALNMGDTTEVKKIFKDNGIELEGTIMIYASQYAKGRVWEVKTDQQTYTVRLETTGTAESMAVYETVTAAILTNAFMKGAILTSANLYNVRASGIQLYGGAKLDGNAILERAQFDNANMGNIDLKQGKLYGMNLDHAVLTNAQFQGASLCQDADGGQTSLERANLQGANFSDADLAKAIFTDAAVSVAQTEGGIAVDGVWLFSVAAEEALINEINAGTNVKTLDPALALDLNQGPVADPVRNALKDKGITLGAQAMVSIQATGLYWDLADGSDGYLISRDCDKKTYQPALAVRKTADTTPLFMMALGLVACLKNGPVDPAVRAVFKTNGIDLGTDASVAVCRKNTDWEIVDTQASYTLWLGLDPSCEWEITIRPSLPTLIELFSIHSTPLTRRTTVVGEGSGRWKIDNDINNPYNATTDYICFNCVHNTDDAELEIYGCTMRVRRMVSGDKLEYHNINCELTCLPEDQMQATTVCPNSLRTEVNQSDNIPYKEWMRAKELPRAPSCIPSKDGYYYCT